MKSSDLSEMGNTLLPLGSIKVVGLAGAGSVGAAWATLLLANEYEVVVYDADPEFETRLSNAIKDAWPVMRALRTGLGDAPPLERIHIAKSLEEMAHASDLIQENVAEALDVKREVFSRIDAALHPNKLILSSSGGVPPSRLQEFCAHPERVLLGHPFNPANIIPLVEVVAGNHTRPDAVDLATAFYVRLGKHPIHLRKEMVGHLTNRLQFAMLREAIYCLSEGVASAQDIDASIRWGLGLRWALMGPLMTFNLAGGSGGIEQIISRFKDDVQAWWTTLGDPQLTEDVCEKLFAGVAELREGRSNSQWAQWRDEALIEMLKFRATTPYLTEQSTNDRRT